MIPKKKNNLWIWNIVRAWMARCTAEQGIIAKDSNKENGDSSSPMKWTQIWHEHKFALKLNEWDSWDVVFQKFQTVDQSLLKIRTVVSKKLPSTSKFGTWRWWPCVMWWWKVIFATIVLIFWAELSNCDFVGDFHSDRKWKPCDNEPLSTGWWQ